MTTKVLELAWKYRTLVLLALLVIATVLALRATHYGASEHARAVQVEKAHKAELARALGEMEQRNADLAAQLAKLRKEHGKVAPASVAHVEGGSVSANPQAAPIKPACPGATSGSPPSSTSTCLFDSSSRARLVLDSTEVVSSKGDRWNVLGISAWRNYPAPETVLFSDGLAIPLAPVSALSCPECKSSAGAKRLTLSLRAAWDPSDLRARPVLAGELAYRLLSLWRADLALYSAVEEHYGAWSGRGGVKLDIGIH